MANHGEKENQAIFVRWKGYFARICPKNIYV